MGKPPKKETLSEIPCKFADKPIMLKKLPKFPLNRVFTVGASHETRT